MMNPIYTIYKATNIVNGKCYIGFTSKWPDRIDQHISSALNSTDTSRKFYCAIRKYGPDAFMWEVLYQSLDVTHTHKVMEPYFIAEHKSNSEFGYNMTDGGDGVIGYEWSDDLRTKHSKLISERHKRNREYYSLHPELKPESKPRKKPESYNRSPHKQETKDKISKAKRGLKWTEETKQRVKETQVRPTQLTEEHKSNISKALLGKPLSEEHCRKISEGKKGKPFTEEHKKHCVDQEHQKLQKDLMRLLQIRRTQNE